MQSKHTPSEVAKEKLGMSIAEFARLHNKTMPTIRDRLRRNPDCTIEALLSDKGPGEHSRYVPAKRHEKLGGLTMREFADKHGLTVGQLKERRRAHPDWTYEQLAQPTRIVLPPCRRGQDHPNAKLTGDDVRQIRRLHGTDGWTTLALSVQFGISESHAVRIVQRKAWKDLPDE